MTRIVILILMLLVTPSYGEPKTIGDNTYGPVDILEAVNASIEFEKARQDAPKKDDPSNINVSTDGLLFSVISKNKWIITQALLYGVSNLDAAAQRLVSEESIRLLMNTDRETQEKINEYLNANEETKKKLMEQFDKDIKDWIEQVGTEGGPTTVIKNLIDQIEKFSKKVTMLKGYPGFSGDATASNGSLFKRTQWLGIILLVLCYIFRLSWDMYEKNVLGQGDSNMLDFIHTTAKFMFLFLATLYLRELVTKGMDISDTVRQMIENTVVGLDSWDIMGDLLRVKASIAQIKGSIGIVDWLKEGAGMVIAKGLGYLCYMIAAAVIAVLLILSDIMMAITATVGPLTFAMAMLPKCGKYIASWIKGYITFLIWGPLAALYVLLMIAIMAVGIDTSALTFIVIAIGYLMGAMQIPNMAESMSGAVLTGVATGLAAAPLVGAKMAGKMTIGGAGAAASAVKKLTSGGK